MSAAKPHIATSPPRRTRSALAAVLGAGALALAGCGEALEVQPVEEDEPEAVLADVPPETDPAALAEASAVLQRVPGGTATPVNGGTLFSGGRGETFGFSSGGPATGSGGGAGGGSGSGSGGGGAAPGSSAGGGRGTAFGSSNADTTAREGLAGAGAALGDAAGAAAAAGSGLVGSGREAAGRAAAAAATAGRGAGEPFGFASGGASSRGEAFGFRTDGGPPPPRSAPAAGVAVDRTPGALPAIPGGGLATPGESFGYRVDPPSTVQPRGFGYAGPPRPEDRSPGRPAATEAAPAGFPAAAAVDTPHPRVAPPTPPVGAAPVDTPLPRAAPTAPPGGVVPARAPVDPAPVAARPRLWGCAPAGRPGAPPRLRMLRPSTTGVPSVAYVCLPAGVRPRFDGWRNGRGVTRITQTADAGDVYEVPAGRVLRAGLGLPADVLAANPELRMVPEPVTAFVGFAGVDALTSRILRRPRATFAEVGPAALRRVRPADLDRVSRAAWADVPVRDLRKLPAVRWTQLSPATVTAVPPARRARLSPAARRAISGRGL